MNLMDIDPIVAATESADHAKAKDRGQRVLLIANRVISELSAEGQLRNDPDDLRAILFHALADGIYGNAAIDVPPLRSGR